MQAAELKAILSKTDEVAFYPTPVVHIEATKRHKPHKAWNRKGYVCPTGLHRGKVIETGVKWVEKRPISACGDTDYEVQRKNGILVEFDLPETWNEQKAKKLPVTEVIERDGQKLVRMVISAAVIYAGWPEYALIEAQREKEREERRRKEKRITDACEALGGIRDWSGYRTEYRETKSGEEKRIERGYVALPIEVAEKLAARIAEQAKSN